MADVVLQTVRLGAPPWPTIDPFLFCVHHDDAYPVGNAQCGPVDDLRGRQIGSDFSGRDGWSMYHGDVVPGFPEHPHRGFETVTFVRRGLIDHADSLGAAARYGQGDVQWMTAGRGIVHAEMFPLLDRTAPNPTELFQIWINLPAADKMVEPHFAMLWDHDIPREAVDGDGLITVAAGAIGDQLPPAPPPHSWASRPEADVAIWHLDLGRGEGVELPPARSSETVRTLYVFDGDGVTIAGAEHPPGTAHVVRSDVRLPLRARGAGVQILVLQGRPIGEPVERYGPFVMNTQEEIARAFEDYQRTGFGGWPWPRRDPIHGEEGTRFARHADGRQEYATTA